MQPRPEGLSLGQEGVIQPQPVQVRVRSPTEDQPQDNRPQDSQGNAQPHQPQGTNLDNADIQTNRNGSNLGNPEATEVLNRTVTGVNPENPIRHAITNVGPLDVQAHDSNDLFTIQEYPRPGHENGLDALQLTQMDSSAPQLNSPPTQLIESSPEREDSPMTRDLQQVSPLNPNRRNNPLGTINSAKSEEDMEKDSPSEKDKTEKRD